MVSYIFQPLGFDFAVDLSRRFWFNCSLAFSVSSAVINESKCCNVSQQNTNREYGLKVFGTGSSNMPIKWTDADFFSNSVGYGNTEVQTSTNLEKKVTKSFKRQTGHLNTGMRELVSRGKGRFSRTKGSSDSRQTANQPIASLVKPASRLYQGPLA
jgi:hypothetical protein